MNRISYIGYATNGDIRYKASSGGIGSAIVKYCFNNSLITHSLSFEYSTATALYKPYWAKSFEEYNISGSIYQEMDMWEFYKKNLTKSIIGDGCALVFSLPCQTRAIRNMAQRNNVKIIVIGLTCSSQQSFEATSYLLSQLGVKVQDVSSLRYRGNGWPSGVQIKTKYGNDVFVPNNRSLWSEIFHSKLFVQKRCFSCKDTLNEVSDIGLADPWINRYIESERIGKTIVFKNTVLGEKVLNGAVSSGDIELEIIDFLEAESSQRGTIVRKDNYLSHKRICRILAALCLNVVYRRVVTSSAMLFRVHCKLKNYLERIMSRSNRSKIGI